MPRTTARGSSDYRRCFNSPWSKRGAAACLDLGDPDGHGDPLAVQSVVEVGGNQAAKFTLSSLQCSLHKLWSNGSKHWEGGKQPSHAPITVWLFIDGNPLYASSVWRLNFFINIAYFWLQIQKVACLSSCEYLVKEMQVWVWPPPIDAFSGERRRSWTNIEKRFVMTFSRVVLQLTEVNGFPDYSRSLAGD